MKIAQVATLFESVPPRYYGGTERVVSYLTEALVKLGHDVTLYASGDSVTAAHLRPVCPRSLRLDEQSVDPVADHVYLAETVFRESAEFDVVHSHIDYIPYPLWRRMHTPHLTTLHGRLDIPNLVSLYHEFSDIPLVSICDFQRRPLPWANWLATVYHGLPKNLYTFYSQPGSYLAFLGRISPEKRADLAIEIARSAGIPLKIAAKVDKNDRAYFKNVVEPLLDPPDIEFLGEIGDTEKNEFLGNAMALLFPIDWPEPFGLVMIEAMACGTPVIARRCGSVPEVIQPETGFIVEDSAGAVSAIRQLDQFDRRRCRVVFEEKFTDSRMANDYLRLFALVREQGLAHEPELIAG
ncbi:MAG TPA: glycosyltransferase family 4 protein [Chthoniobacterales bacterium]